MFISCPKEEASLPLDEPFSAAHLQDSPTSPTAFTDVSVVPEHERNELEQSIRNLEGEIAFLRDKERQLDKKRREALNKLLDVKGSIRVMCRVRPFLPTEKRQFQEPVSSESEKIVVKTIASRKEFRFDKIFDQASSQENIYVEIEPILRSALDGHNVSILAYGQTGTGKTFTMDGTNNQPGLIPRALEQLYRRSSSHSSLVTFSMSMLEVYMGSLRDLLAPKVAARTYDNVARCNLNIQTDPKGMVEVEGLTEVEIPFLAKAKWWYAKGRRARSTSWTNVNEMSSRSHCLMRITISRHTDDQKAKPHVSKLWLVDLGGSERLLKTGAAGQTLDEGRAINLSLSALGDVVAALRRKRAHIPYRNSKLTQILKDSLGFGSKVLMLVHISPCEEDVGETICSLSLANRARAIEINGEDTSKQKQKRILELEGNMREAEEDCQKVRNQLNKAEILLSETKRILSTPKIPDVKLMSPGSLTAANKSTGTPPVVEKSIRRFVAGSLPRFMTSTVASRQRQTAVERDVIGRAKSTKSVARILVQLSASQSLSYSDIRLKGILRESNRGSPRGEGKAFVSEAPTCNGFNHKAASSPRLKLVAASDPNFKNTLGRHRRRMSSLI